MQDYQADTIKHILETTKVIALVGASDKPARASHRVMAFLLDKGYRVIPVNPGKAGGEILGQTVVGSLAQIDEPVDMVDIFRNSEAAGQVVDEAISIKAKVIWMQLGVINEEAAARAEAEGITVIMDRCPKIEYPIYF